MADKLADGQTAVKYKTERMVPMADKHTPLHRFVSLYVLYGKMDLAWFLRDTKYALLGVLADVVSNLAAIGSVFLLAWKFDGVGGMSKYEVLFMLGYTTIITGLFTTFWANGNTGHISRRIGRGQLDHMMIQPLPLPVQLMVDGFIPFTGSSNLWSGTAVLGVSIRMMGIALPWWWIFSLFLNLFLTLVIILSQSYLFSSAAFYAPAAAEEISSTVIDLQGNLSQYPLSGMPLKLQISLLSVFPAGLLGWFPTLALLGKPPLGLPFFLPALMAVLLFLLSQFVFRKGMKHYVKSGSNRYLSRGFRS